MFISFLGIGQGGSSICDVAAREGFYTACINYSQTDLDSLEHVEHRLKLVGSEGAGKDRKISIELMNDNWDLATNFIKEKFAHSSIEIVFVPFSTSGGSGSGTSPILLNLLTELMPDKVFVAMPIIPSKDEVFINQRNCLDTFEDLSKLDICILPIDNEKVRATLNNVGRYGLYKSINEKVISLISKLIDYTNKDSKYGVLDKKDLKNIFSTKGLATITETNLTQLTQSNELSVDGITDRIQKSWNHSIFANINLSQVINAGIIYDGQERLMDFLNLRKVFAAFNNKMPIGLFEGYYTHEKGNIISILTGLSWCNERLSQVDDIIESQSDSINQINKDDQVYKSRTTNMKLTTAPKEKKSVDIRDIISRYKR